MCYAGAEKWRCSTCGEANDPTEDFCQMCDMPYDLNEETE